MGTRAKTIALVSGIAGASAAALLLFFCDPARVPIYPVCQFHQLTGFNCPGCGSLRAMHHLLNGQIVEAMRHHALLVCSLPLFAGLASWCAWRKFRGQQATPFRAWWVWLYVALWIVFGIAREIPQFGLAALSP